MRKLANGRSPLQLRWILVPCKFSHVITILYLLLFFPNFRFFVVDTLLSFSLTSITAAHCVLRIVQTINIWRDCSETFLFERVGFLFICYKIKFSITIFSKKKTILGTLLIGFPTLCAGFQFDYVYDWTILKYQQSQMTSVPPRAIVSATQSSSCTCLRG
jgi:hypothetical protein